MDHDFANHINKMSLDRVIVGHTTCTECDNHIEQCITGFDTTYFRSITRNVMLAVYLVIFNMSKTFTIVAKTSERRIEKYIYLKFTLVLQSKTYFKVNITVLIFLAN